MIPKEARTFTDLLKLTRDNVDGTGWWFMLGEGDEVMFAQQYMGEAPTGTVKIPRKEFDALVRWYTTGKWKP